MEEHEHKKEVETFIIFVNNNEIKTKKHELTGAEIKALAGFPADYELFEVRGDQTIPIGNEEIVKVHDKMHFRAIPSGTFGSCRSHRN